MWGLRTLSHLHSEENDVLTGHRVLSVSGDQPVPPPQGSVLDRAPGATSPKGHPMSQETQRTTAGRHSQTPQNLLLLRTG